MGELYACFVGRAEQALHTALRRHGTPQSTKGAGRRAAAPRMQLRPVGRSKGTQQGTHHFVAGPALQCWWAALQARGLELVKQSQRGRGLHARKRLCGFLASMASSPPQGALPEQAGLATDKARSDAAAAADLVQQLIRCTMPPGYEVDQQPQQRTQPQQRQRQQPHPQQQGQPPSQQHEQRSEIEEQADLEGIDGIAKHTDSIDMEGQPPSPKTPPQRQQQQ